MSTKKIYIYIFAIGLLYLIGTAFRAREKDPLDKRVFTTRLIEVKNGVNDKKSLDDEIEFKDGKMFSNKMEEKQGLKWVKYRINKDSLYIDDTETEIRYFEVEVSHTDDADQTFLCNLKIDGYDIEGEIKITKKDKLKKMWVFSGAEKYKKPKKNKEESK